MSMNYKGPVVLVIMDGVGLSKRTKGNAVKQARLETLCRLVAKYPCTKLGASGRYVGIPDQDMGNSEVGHNAMGAGEIITQGTKLVDEAIIKGEAFYEPTWQNAMQKLKKYNSTLHFMGIFSDGNVHSNISHLEAMLSQAYSEGVPRVRMHALLDGRDVPPRSEPKYIKRFEDYIQTLGNPDYKIASGGGRMHITADRYENDWPMVERGWRTHVLGDARPFASASEAITTFRSEIPGLQDQYMPAFVVVDELGPIGTIQDHDVVIYLDFRADRALEITKAFTYDDFPYFDRVRRPNVDFIGMTEYDVDIHVPALTLVQPVKIQHPLSKHLSLHGIKQFAISETVKFGHISYYFNGNSYDIPEGEVQREIPSGPDLFTQRPWMQSADITDELVAAVESGDYQFIRVNYPNGDMVGHFAEMEPTIIAMKALDIGLKRLIEAVNKQGGVTIITADHGNAEELLDAQGKPKTAHTTNPVPCIFVDDTENAAKYRLAKGDFGLANLASTISMLLAVEAQATWLPPIIELK